MHHKKTSFPLGIWALFFAACAPPQTPPAASAAQKEPAGETAPAPLPAKENTSKQAMSFESSAVHDDARAAFAKAKTEGKAVLVDAWAPWCHTCLSMRNYVLSDASLAPLAGRVQLLAIDTDRPENAAFLERYSVSVWPTFFMIEPSSEKILGVWQGSASAREFRQFVEEGLAEMDDARAEKAPAGSAEREFLDAKAALAKGDHVKAADAFERAVNAADAAKKNWSRKDEALSGLIFSLYRAKDYPRCARTGQKYMPGIQGAAVPADFASMLLACASKLPKGEEQDKARNAAVERLLSLVKNPPAEASADDRADAMAILADAQKEGGDAAAAKKTNEARIALLEEAARQAKSPEIAATYDYARAGAYVALGRGDEAIKMLTERESQKPDSYEPPARLAGVYVRLEKYPEALAAIDRALSRSYGPRKLQYLKVKSDILGKLGDTKAQVETLRQEVAGHEALAKGHADADRLADAKKRLAEAEKKLAK